MNAKPYQLTMSGTRSQLKFAEDQLRRSGIGYWWEAKNGNNERFSLWVNVTEQDPITGTAYPLMKSEYKCSVEGCHRLSKARGFCDSHYNQWREGHGP